jgi:RNA polymerase sigma-70 factor, ECF subfamily
MTNWEEVVGKYAPMVVRISWRILGNAADAEDNVQDVFMAACRIHEQTAVRHWPGLLRRIATLGALAKRRQRRFHAPLDGIAQPDKNALTPQETAIRREQESSLRDAVATLPEREGAAFVLRYFENLELPEVARCLGISYSAVGAAVSRARAKLTEMLSETETETEKKNDGCRKTKAKLPARLG